MKQGMTMEALQERLNRERELRKDLIVDPRQLVMYTDDDDELKMEIVDVGRFGVLDNAHRQFSGFLGIPKKYYDRCAQQAPALLAQQVNRWMTDHDKGRLVRLMGDDVRAFLSDRYRRMDYLELLNACMPTLQDMEAQALSANLNETRLSLKFSVPSVEAAIKSQRAEHRHVGEVVRMGVSLGGSEVGHGTTYIDDLDYFLECLNGMIAAKVFKRRHVGARMPEGDVESFYSDEARQADDTALWLKVRDALRHALEPARFHERMEQYQRAADTEPVQNPIAAVQVLADRFELPEEEAGMILGAFVQSPDMTQFGLAQAVSAASKNEGVVYERATELEAAGGAVIDLSGDEWKGIATATQVVQA